MSDNTVASLNGFFKEIYAKQLKNLIPDGVKLMNDIQFSQRDKLGNYYHFPVSLQSEHGVTFNDGDGSAFTLGGAVAGATKDATVRGSELVLQSTLSYSAASRAVGGGEKAFMDATKYLVANMVRSVSKKLEAEMFYGQVGYGTVSAATDSPNTVTITEAEYAEGIWSGAEGMTINIRDTAGTTSRGDFLISKVDIENRKLTLTTAPVAAGVIATDVIWHKGAYSKEFAGLHKIMTNTGSLFGIDAGTYSLWRSSEYSAASGQLSFAKINSAISRGVAKGLESDVKVYVNPLTWSNLLSDQAALRRFDGSYKSSEAEVGHKSIKMYSQTGTMEIVPSIYVKRGFAYIFTPDELQRVGSTDVTFERPGADGKFFRDLDSQAGFELRLFADWALAPEAPGRLVLIKDIVNS